MFRSIATKIPKSRGFGETYGLRKVIRWLDKNGVPQSDYHIASSPASDLLYDSAIYLKLDDVLTMSIQMDPVVSGPAFCETAIVDRSNVLYESSLGYCDVRRWNEPEEAFQHIDEIRKKFKDPEFRKTLNFSRNVLLW